MSQTQYYENYFGVLLTIRIFKQASLIKGEEKNLLFNKIANSNINTIIVDTHLNYGILSVESHLLWNFLMELRAVFNGQIVLLLAIFGELSLQSYSNNIIFTYFDNILLDLYIERHIITEEEKSHLLIEFYNMKKKKIILNQEFLDLDPKLLNKCCAGFLMGSLEDLERIESYGAFLIIVNFSIINWGNPVFFQRFWDYIIFNQQISIVHILAMPLLSLFEILNSTMYLKDQDVKIEVIGKIRQLESQIMKESAYSGVFGSPWVLQEGMEKNINQIIEFILERKNHVFQDLDL